MIVIHIKTLWEIMRDESNVKGMRPCGKTRGVKRLQPKAKNKTLKSEEMRRKLNKYMINIGWLEHQEIQLAKKEKAQEKQLTKLKKCGVGFLVKLKAVFTLLIIGQLVFMAFQA